MPIKPTHVDEYLENGCGRCDLGGTPDCKVHAWEESLREVRSILAASQLTEEIKWGAPCYSHEGKNILMLSALKNCVVVSFFRGGELKDEEHVLEQPGENSRFARYIRISEYKSITTLRPILLDYIEEAVKLELSGKKDIGSNASNLEYPDELEHAFKSDRAFESAFNALTPGRQRGYLIHFTSAKQSKTRTARILRFKSKIIAGKGWNER